MPKPIILTPNFKPHHFRNMETENKPYFVSKDLSRSRYYMGGYWTFLATGKETGGQFALIEINLRRGIEPPQHTHTNEDEMYYIVQGEMQFAAGDEVRDVKAGDSIFLPKGIPHGFRLKSDTVKALVLISPAGLEDMFWELGKPAEKLEFPAMPAGPPSPEFLDKVKAIQVKFGIVGMDNSKLKVS